MVFLLLVYIYYMCTKKYIYVYKKIVIERTRDLIYKFVVKDFFPKINSSTAGENADDSV